jgi:hypothetical protein
MSRNVVGLLEPLIEMYLEKNICDLVVTYTELAETEQIMIQFLQRISPKDREWFQNVVDTDWYNWMWLCHDSMMHIPWNSIEEFKTCLSIDFVYNKRGPPAFPCCAICRCAIKVDNYVYVTFVNRSDLPILILPSTIPAGEMRGKNGKNGNNYTICQACGDKCMCTFSEKEKENAVSLCHDQSRWCQLCDQNRCNTHDFSTNNDVICNECRSDFRVFVLSKKQKTIVSSSSP